MRTKGSCRFAPYYKIQFRNQFLAWQDIQQSYDTKEAAVMDFPDGKECRIMEITERGRRPIKNES